MASYADTLLTTVGAEAPDDRSQDPIDVDGESSSPDPVVGGSAFATAEPNGSASRPDLHASEAMRIVAIGGGEIGRLETLELDAEVVRLTGKRRPRVVFLPTATADDPGYVAVVEQHYGQRLGCEVSPLLLYDHRAAAGDVERTLRSADIVYVGGGNTLRMMKLWRRRGVDTALRQAAAEGTVLAGISAGAICWCSWGVSDSRSFTTTGGSWEYIAVRGLGLVDIVMCPHFNADADRQTAAVALARRRRCSVLGLDDSAALEIVDESWRILSARDGSTAHLVGRSGAVHERSPSVAFRPLRDLSNA